jgi:hypothetical protein
MAGDWNELKVLVELAKHCMGIWCLVDFTINSDWYWGNCTEFSLSLILTDWDMLWINQKGGYHQNVGPSHWIAWGISGNICMWCKWLDSTPSDVSEVQYPVPGEKQQMGMQHLQSYSKSIATYYPFKHFKPLTCVPFTWRCFLGWYFFAVHYSSFPVSPANGGHLWHLHAWFHQLIFGFLSIYVRSPLSPCGFDASDFSVAEVLEEAIKISRVLSECCAREPREFPAGGGALPWSNIPGSPREACRDPSRDSWLVGTGRSPQNCSWAMKQMVKWLPSTWGICIVVIHVSDLSNATGMPSACRRQRLMCHVPWHHSQGNTM